MKSYDSMTYHATTEQIVQTICRLVQNNNPHFFRLLVNYHLTKMASIMRVKVQSKAHKTIPINFYACNLAGSGQGKGFSTTIMEERLLSTFKSTFTQQTFPYVIDKNLARIAILRSNLNGIEPEEELEKVRKEFEALGPYLFAFDSGTTPALKQARHKLLMSEIGALNLEIDEVGTNLQGNAEILGTFLELFDLGKVKQKLVKNTKENLRNEDIDGKTPANLLLFGTPSKLLDGAKVEDDFISLLQTGYARRCFFGYTRTSHKNLELTPEEMYDMLVDTSQDQLIVDLAAKFGQLATPMNHNKIIALEKDVNLLLLEYKIDCERRASFYKEHQEIERAELEHRYFKVMKLAGTYAFLDGNSSITEDQLYAAIRMAEDSGIAFSKLIRREPTYAKLAKFIADAGHELTHANIAESLPFYKGSSAAKADLMTYAIAWGYKNNIIIKKAFSDGVEFISGDSLTETSLDKIRIAYSKDIVHHYRPADIKFSELTKLTQQPDFYWANHQFKNQYRHEENLVPGFNLIVLDVDDGTPLDTARELLKEYACLFYTTKRHTDAKNRFRVVIPIKYHLNLGPDEFKEFMKNFYSWLPFQVDTAAQDPARRWSSYNGKYCYSVGKELVDPVAFIPKTSKNDEREKVLLDMGQLSNLERWFVANTGDGNRNNQLLKYALMLVDSGGSATDVHTAVSSLNSKLRDKLDQRELDVTILATANKAIKKRDE